MSFSKPEDDPNEPVKNSTQSAVTVPWEDEPVPVGEAVETMAERSGDSETEALAQAVATNVEDLREQVEQQEAVIHELVELVELLGAAVDHEEIANAAEARDEYGSDIYPWDWETETLDFKSNRYE
jgi:hypothetical protein